MRFFLNAFVQVIRGRGLFLSFMIIYPTIFLYYFGICLMLSNIIPLYIKNILFLSAMIIPLLADVIVILSYLCSHRFRQIVAGDEFRSEKDKMMATIFYFGSGVFEFIGIGIMALTQ